MIKVLCNECSDEIKGAQPLNCHGLSQAVIFCDH